MEVIYKACAPPHCKCPEIIFNKENDVVTITDDYNGKVKMTYEQWELMVSFFHRNKEEWK